MSKTLSAEAFHSEQEQLSEEWFQNKCGDARCEERRLTAARLVIRGGLTHSQYAERVEGAPRGFAELLIALREAPSDPILPTYIDGTYFCRYCFALDDAGSWEVWDEGHGHMKDCWLVTTRALIGQLT